MKPIRPLAAVLVVMLTLPALGGRAKLESRYLDRDVTIDGAMVDWEGALTHFEDAQVDLGVLNDGEFVYLFLRSRDRQVGRQAMMLGLQLWLDAEGGDAKRFGIQYPPGVPGGPSGMRGADREQMRAKAEEALQNFELLGPGEERQTVGLDNALGIEVRTGGDNWDFTYELKIPLAVSELHPYAVGAEPGRAFGIVFETVEMDMDAMREQSGGRGGMRGGMGGGGMGGGGGRGMRGERPEPFKFKARVRLAESPEPAAD